MSNINYSLFLLCLFVVLHGCDSGMAGDEGPSSNPESESIGAFITNLNYDADELLNVQPSDKARDPLGETESFELQGNDERRCVSTTFDLKNNFEDISILRPTQDVIWPGALVEGNQSLLDGLPEPARFSRAPIKIRIDLPGIGENGTQTIEDPDQARIQNAIDESLEWWNANAFQEGYRNASSSSNQVVTSYSSTQAALDLGLNVEWATGDVRSQFNFETSETQRVVMATYKQAFYTVTFVQENGSQPEDVFGPDVSLSQIQRAFNSEAPPAYIASVTYGRIIMFRMETSSSYTSVDVEAAFRYAAGASVDGSLASTYEEILANSSVEVITLGGNAAVASDAINARSAGDLAPIITGENAVYSRGNPGVPISYTVKYLKDDQLAKLGYTTEYTATECSVSKVQNTIRVFLDKYTAIRDCDSPGPGDFEFESIVRYNGVQEGKHTRTVALNNDDSDNIGEEIVFSGRREEGNNFAITFVARERDDPPFAEPNYNDLNRQSTKTHTFAAGGWSNLASTEETPITIDVSKAESCRVRLTYRVEVD